MLRTEDSIWSAEYVHVRSGSKIVHIRTYRVKGVKGVQGGQGNKYGDTEFGSLRTWFNSFSRNRYTEGREQVMMCEECQGKQLEGRARRRKM